MDEIDTAIMQLFEDNEADWTVTEVYDALKDTGLNLTRKRVRRRLNSLVNYSYLESSIEKGLSGGHYLRYAKKVTA